jgi:predicted RND superfamily exporter protein
MSNGGKNMRKITDVIVKLRYVFLVLFLVAAGFSFYLSTKVNINEDIMKYLPSSSETKIGKDIMDESFTQQNSSVLNVLFKDLEEDEKQDTLKKLENINDVHSVDYDTTTTYNKENYTLYVLHVDDYADSEKAINVYNEVSENFKTAGMSGSIYDENKPILQLSIVVIAIICAMIILVILSDSYIEPFLYLISIGIAVFINKGTNIMFDSVSSITNSIVAILQLALSMDYSIMLSNRYKQEKENYNNKLDAMKEALYQSFKSITSSSVTTIVGLLALVFMSFTIGKDLGFVLAKGVLLSLVSIFFCLPALLLLFDPFILKTHKKSPKFNLNKLGNFSYKSRYIQSILIVLLFIVAYLLQGNVKILYTDSEQDKVGSVFQATNQIAIVYENKYEDFIASYCKELEKDKKIDQVLCYSNTINEKLTYNELNHKFKDLGQDTQIDEYLIKIIYYNYYSKDKENTMTLNEFISFIQSDIYSNENLNSSLNQDTKENLELLQNFTDSSLINQKRTAKELANILGMKEEEASNILIYYNSKNLDTKMTIKDFVDFILKDVLNDSKYASSFDKTTISKLKQLQIFTDTSKINKAMKEEELANLFGMDKNQIEQLFLLYSTFENSDTEMTLNAFANFALSMAKEDAYKNLFDENTLQSLTLLSTLSNEKNINTKLDISSMKESLRQFGFSFDDQTLSLLYIYYTGNTTESKLTLNDFATTALSMASQDAYKDYFHQETIQLLQKIELLNSYYNKELPNGNLYSMFGIKQEIGEKLNQAITGDLNGTYLMTPLQFINTLLGDTTILAQLDANQISSLKMATHIMNNVSTMYSAEEISLFLSQDKTVISMIYGVYDYQALNLKNISIKELINFLYQNKENPLLSAHLETAKELLTIGYQIVNHTTTAYHYTEISQIIGVEESQVKQIFGVYDYHTKEKTMTPLSLANFIIDNKENPLLSNKISASSFKQLTLVKEVMNATLNHKNYSPKQLSTLLNINSDTMHLLFSLYDSKYIKANETISLYDFVHFIVNNVMNNKEFSGNFDYEKKEKLNTIASLMNQSLRKTEYTSNEAFAILKILSDDLDQSLIDLVYLYYNSQHEFDDTWTMTVEEFINYLNTDIIRDSRFDDFINADKRKTITNSKKTIDTSKELIVSDKYSRVILNTKYSFEGEDVYKFIESMENKVGDKDGIYIAGNSSMAVEMSKTFNKELNKITLLTMIFIFIVVAITFKDLIIPSVLVLIIQTAVYVTMSAISISGGAVYFISLLIVQAILMGATIDYAIVYTAYYRESRLTMGVKDSIINAYNKSIHTIISSSSILIIVTLVVANFASAIAAKICETISEGTFAAVLLILLILPGVLATTDKFICRKGYYNEKKKRK